MRKVMRKDRCITLLVVALIVTAYVIRMGSSQIFGLLRSAIYLGLFLAWGISVRWRVIVPRMQRLFLALSFLMLFWMLARTVRFFANITTIQSRHLWYLYYIPMIFIPLIAFLIALSLGESERDRPPKWIYAAYGLGAVLALLALTNDFHRLLFDFPTDSSILRDEEYVYGPVYFIIAGWRILCLIFILITIFIKSRIPNSQKLILRPMLPASLVLLYGLLYITRMEWVRIILPDLTVTESLLTIAVLESCLRTGLIQSNTHYDEMFRLSTIHAQIADSRGIVLESKSAMPISRENIEQAKTAPVMLNDKIRLSSAPIRNGTVLWQEDVSELLNTVIELEDVNEYLRGKRNAVQTEYETRRRWQSLQEKNMLYNKMMMQTERHIRGYDRLLDKIETSEDPEETKRVVFHVAVVSAYIKRRNNLIFLAESNGTVAAGELEHCFSESIDNLRLGGVNCGYSADLAGTMSFDTITFLYDSFQTILLSCMDALSSLYVWLSQEGERYRMDISAVSDVDLFALQISGLAVEEEDGEWMLHLEVQGGGDGT